MEKENLKKIIENYKWYEKIIVKIFKKIFIKVYNNMRLNIVNSLIK